MELNITIQIPDELSSLIVSAISTKLQAVPPGPTGVAEPFSAAKLKTEPESKAPAETPAETPAEKPEPKVDREEVLKRAMAFLDSTPDGENALSAILSEMGIARVSDCPDDRVAEFLSRLATA